MENHPGIFLVLEGADGSGKGTQFNLLTERLQAVGYEVATFDFPRYEQASSHFVRKYLNGEYGPASNINPYTASLFYALDRFEAAKDINQAIQSGKVVLSNRYVGSNMAHQGSKFVNQAEQRGFFLWADSLEYQLLGIPRPTLNLFLKLPAEVSYELIAKKTERSYTKHTRDEHEKDINHLRGAVDAYELLCNLFPKDFVVIECAQDNRLLSIPVINDKIWKAIQPLLTGIPKSKPHPKTLDINPPNTNKINKTQSDDRPRKQDTLDAEKLIPLGKISILLQRALLSTPSLNVRSLVSNNQPVDFVINDDWFMPQELNNIDIKKLNALKKQAGLVYEGLSSYLNLTVKELEIDKKAITDIALKGIRPLLALEEVVISGDKDTILKSIENLINVGTKEATNVINKILDHLRESKVKSVQPLQSEQTSIINEVLAKLPNPSFIEPYIELEKAVPRNELDIIGEIVYSQSGMKKKDLQKSIDELTHQEKSQILARLLKNNKIADPILGSKVSYEFDILSTGSVLVDALSASKWVDVNIQTATPRYGYEIPEIIELAGLAEQYSRCFDISLELYSSLQGRDLSAAQYVVLEGHRGYWQANITAGSLLNVVHSLRKSPKMQKYLSRPFFKTLSEKVAEVHPLIFNSLFIDAPVSKNTLKTKLHLNPNKSPKVTEYKRLDQSRKNKPRRRRSSNK